MTETILPIVLIVLVLVGIWAVVEIALTMRTARREVEQVSASAREVVEQTQPVVAKLDGIMSRRSPWSPSSTASWMSSSLRQSA